MMRKVILSMLSVVGLVFVLGVSAVLAQTQYRAHIPFDFSTKDEVYKAGEYTLGPASGSINYNAIMLTNRDNGKAKFLRGASMGADPQRREGKLIFAVTDGKYVLTDIETPLWNMKMKRTVTRVNLVKGKAPKPETVTIFLN
jgi:hypothetical protein